jgi:hypothetical protein
MWANGSPSAWITAFIALVSASAATLMNCLIVVRRGLASQSKVTNRFRLLGAKSDGAPSGRPIRVSERHPQERRNNDDVGTGEADEKLGASANRYQLLFDLNRPFSKVRFIVLTSWSGSTSSESARSKIVLNVGFISPRSSLLMYEVLYPSLPASAAWETPFLIRRAVTVAPRAFSIVSLCLRLGIPMGRGTDQLNAKWSCHMWHHNATFATWDLG